MTERVLILGATGAIGSHAVRACIASGWEVSALVRPTSDRRDLEGLNVQLFEGDIRRPESLKRALGGCDAFVHAAGFYPSHSMRASRAVAAGLASVRPVFQAALEAGVKRGVYVSSLSTMAASRTRAGVGPYSAAKAAMELAALESAAAGLPLVIVNPTLCLGEFDRKPSSGRIVIEVAQRRLPFYVEAPVNVVYTGDVGLGIAHSLERGQPGRRYVLGGTNTTLQWLLSQIAFEAGVARPHLRLPLAAARAGARVADLLQRLQRRAAAATIAMELIAHSRHLDTGQAAQELGLAVPTPAVETVRRAVSWFREVGMLTSDAPPDPR